MKIFLILFVILTSNLLLAEFKVKIDHHGNIVNPISLNKNQINFIETEFDEELKFSSELFLYLVNKILSTK